MRLVANDQINLSTQRILDGARKVFGFVCQRRPDGEEGWWLNWRGIEF
jgi:hypothetical protein